MRPLDRPPNTFRYVPDPLLTHARLGQGTDAHPTASQRMSGAAPTTHFDAWPQKQGLYNPENEKDACGVGFIAELSGKPSHETVRDAAVILTRLNHRGACGCEEETGDGAGMLISMPDKLYRKVCEFKLPPLGEYSAGIVFFPKDEAAVAAGKKIFEDAIAKFGQKLLGWRKIPVRNNHGKGLGQTALACEPYMEQIFVGFADGVTQEQREPLLFGIRRTAQLASDRTLESDKRFYICSLSSRVITYKGMLTAHQLTDYFADLEDPDCESHVAMVHSRFATNTFPGWKRAHPYRSRVPSPRPAACPAKKRLIAPLACAPLHTTECCVPTCLTGTCATTARSTRYAETRTTSRGARACSSRICCQTSRSTAPSSSPRAPTRRASTTSSSSSSWPAARSPRPC